MWWMIFIASILLLSFWFLRSFWEGVNKVRTAEREVERDMNEIRLLSVSAAEVKSQQLIKESALIQEWLSPPALEVEHRLDALGVSIGRLLRKYRRIVFLESGTEIGAEFLLNPDMPVDMFIVGGNRMNNYRLGTKTESDIVYEIEGNVIRESYPTIFHYMLMVEGSD